MEKEMSVLLDQPMGQTDPWRSVEAAELAQVDGGLLPLLVFGIAAVGGGLMVGGLALVIKRATEKAN